MTTPDHTGKIRTPRFRFLKAYAATLRVLLSYALFSLSGTLLGKEWSRRRSGRVHRRNARRVTRTILELQGLYIKIGQLVSIMTNFLPEDFRAGLEELQDRVPPRPVEEIAERIRREFGKGPHELFAEFGTHAIASASLAQVHEARTAAGERVAVKVQHANIEETARRDLRTIRSLLRFLGALFRVRGLEEQYRQLEEMILEELDFEQERKNLEAISANFVDDPRVRFPKVVAERSSRRVLTTEFIDGVKATDLAALEAFGVDRKELAERIVAAYSRMIFADGLYHADPHPGNILVRPDGVIVFLDFGAVAQLSPQMKSGIPRFLMALIRRDVEGFRDALLGMGFIAREGNEEEGLEALDRFHEQLFERLNLDGLTLGDLNPESTMEMKMAAISDFRSLDISFRSLAGTFRIPKDWLLLERTVLLLVGLCTHLDPGMNPLKSVRPYLEEYVLGSGGTWRASLSNAVRDMALTALTLPEDFRKLLGKANKGKLEIRVREIRQSANLLYALGHQFLYALFALAAGAVAYAGHVRGEEEMRRGGIWVALFFLLCMVVSMIRGRKWR